MTVAAERISVQEALHLWQGPPLELARRADEVRRRRFPENHVTFIKDRVINYTNVCITDCGFCAFYRPPKHPEGYLLTRDEVFRRIDELVRIGGTQVLMQGGHHPNLKIEFYEELFSAIKARFPIYLHALSASELDHIAKVSHLSLEEVVRRLKSAGWDSLPGGGAEILVDEVRERISPLKISADRWFEIHETLHGLGVESTATMVYGFGERLEHRLQHLDRVRALQDRTGRFRAFIPWSFTPYRTALSDVPTAAGLEYLKVIALARLFLDNVRHIDCGWLTEGQRVCQMALFSGADDIGGLVMDDRVISATGVEYQIGVNRILSLIRHSGRIPALRNTEYQILKIYEAGEWEGATPA
ncbi:MAG TPA: cyclic dehypoxanthinyl futalosine synthase [Candidatus Xenobia bacterium]